MFRIFSLFRLVNQFKIYIGFAVIIAGLSGALYWSVSQQGALKTANKIQENTIEQLGNELETYKKLSRDSLSRYENSDKRVEALRKQLASYTVKQQDCYRGDELLDDIFIQLRGPESNDSQ